MTKYVVYKLMFSINRNMYEKFFSVAEVVKKKTLPVFIIGVFTKLFFEVTNKL